MDEDAAKRHFQTEEIKQTEPVHKETVGDLMDMKDTAQAIQYGTEQIKPKLGPGPPGSSQATGMANAKPNPFQMVGA